MRGLPGAGGATAAALTFRYGDPHRVTLASTDRVSARLEDLQDIIGEGPGHAAWSTGQIELGVVPGEPPDRWAVFTAEAAEVVDSALILAVPMRPWAELFGVATLYQFPRPTDNLRLQPDQLQFLANAVGAALLRDTAAVDPDAASPWTSRSTVHQATGMVVAQLRVNPEDALALLRAHAYAQRASLADIAASVVERRLSFSLT